MESLDDDECVSLFGVLLLEFESSFYSFIEGVEFFEGLG